MLSLIAALFLYTIDEEMLCELSVKCVLMPAVAVRDRLSSYLCNPLSSNSGDRGALRCVMGIPV